MKSEDELERAQADADAARARLMGNVHALQARLAPNSLVGDVVDAVREKGGDVVDGAARAVAKRPAVASAAAVGLVALLARKPIAKLFARFQKD